MNKEEDIKETVCNDIFIYLSIKIKKMKNMLAGNNIDSMLLVKYQIIIDTLQRLTKKYLEIKENSKLQDPKIVNENGKISYIIKH